MFLYSFSGLILIWEKLEHPDPPVDDNCCIGFNSDPLSSFGFSMVSVYLLFQSVVAVMVLN